MLQTVSCILIIAEMCGDSLQMRLRAPEQGESGIHKKGVQLREMSQIHDQATLTSSHPEGCKEVLIIDKLRIVEHLQQEEGRSVAHHAEERQARNQVLHSVMTLDGCQTP